MYRQSNNDIPVINVASSSYDSSESLQIPERRLNRSVVELLVNLNETRLQGSEPGDQDHLSSLELEDNESNSTSTSASQVPRSTTPLVRISTFIDNVQAQVVHFPELQGLDDQRSSFHNWLISTVILDDLSYRELFIDPAQDANQLTEEDLFYRALDLYENADLMRPQQLVDLPFLPCTMRTGDTLLDIPFLDPLLIVVWCLHLEDVHWMLNVLPWRVIDRPIRTGRSILAVSIIIST